MTVIGVASFFDKKSRHIGYVMASDSRVGFADLSQQAIEDLRRQKETRVEKCFTGKNFIGLFSGIMRIEPGETHEKAHSSKMRSLDKRFEDIEANKIYENLPILTLEGVQSPTIVLAKRALNSVRLYTVREHNPDARTWIAHQLHVGSKEAYLREKSTIWWGPINGELKRVPLDKRHTPEEAQQGLYNLLQIDPVKKLLGYDPTPLFVYFISPKEHGRIEHGKLVPIRS
ncbi:MAG: hypothetical protein IIA87_02780 [Nanoarchaeota archaeon]|nr:hypothetical protein [Nanoarchaeota archaeon]